MDIYDLLVYKAKRPIPIISNKCFLKSMGCPLLGEGDWRKWKESGMGGGEKCPFYRGHS